MILKTSAAGNFYEFELLQEHRDILTHAVFTRMFNLNSPVAKKILNIPTAFFSFKNQLHGTTAHIITSKKESPGDGDIFITREPVAPLTIRIADCASILLFDPITRTIANIHAGWRGLAQRAIRETISIFRTRFNSRGDTLLACISPMLGPCCSRFSHPHEELPRFMHRHITEENHVNLWSAIEEQLVECGIPKKQIENPRMCTSCHTEEFYSYRREKTSKRFGTIIMLR